MLQLLLLTLLEVSPLLISAQTAPNVTRLSNEVYGCNGEGFTYRCEGSGAFLVWSIGSFPQVVYDSASNILGDGFIRGPVVTNLIQETPTLISTLTVYGEVTSPLPIICATGPSLVSLTNSEETSYTPSGNPGTPGITTNMVNNEVMNLTIDPRSGNSEIESYMINMSSFINNTIESYDTLFVSGDQTQVLIPICRLNTSSSYNISFEFAVAAITECQTISSVMSTGMHTTLCNMDEPVPPPPPCVCDIVCLIILVILLSLALLLVLILTVTLVVREKSKPALVASDIKLSSNVKEF